MTVVIGPITQPGNIGHQTEERKTDVLWYPSEEEEQVVAPSDHLPRDSTWSSTAAKHSTAQ